MADGFAIAVERWCAKAKGQADVAFREIAQALHARVQELTPVKTGYLRASWTVLKNDDPLPTPLLNTARQPDGSFAVATTPTLLALKDVRMGDVLHVTNNVRYAMRIEFGFVGQDSLGRRYSQPARGMVAQTIAEAPAIAAAVLARITGSR